MFKMKKTVGLAIGAVVLTTLSGTAQAFDKKVSVSAIAGTTGFGADASWRFHENLAVTARYTGGLDFDTDFDEDGVNYDADFEMKASSVKMDYFPFGGRFFLSAGIMMPDIEANVVGTPDDDSTYEFNNRTYTAAEIGSVVGTATVSDGTQPYVGLGWRSSHQSGLSFFSEFGVVATNVDVSLSTTNGFENNDPRLQQDIRAEEQSLKDDIDKLPVFPVAVLGVTYTF
ncbi:hypothetical protein HVA01_33460 [Halovibrio variabilis]|uniref:Outer membrane protein n=2 Tax=Halovibrio variabilis TaxID=31910 RepID=A0A511USZ3_9GAMM|nr:hypothetical protein HVA01_33460 [Halovibrio variabilis]